MKKTEDNMTDFISKRVILLRVGQLNSNGTIYKKESLDSALTSFNLIKDRVGAFFGELGRPDSTLLSLVNISHKVEYPILSTTCLTGVIVPLDTPKGRILKEIMESEFDLSVGCRALSKVNDKKEIESLELISVDVLPLEEKF